MHLQQTQSAGPAENGDNKQLKEFIQKSHSLPFGQDLPLSSISGPTYLTAQALVQQVAYTLSDKIFSYSPETFDLDVALKHWESEKEKNAFGYAPGVQSMQTRTGAGLIALGYIFSPDFDPSKRHIPQSVVASTATLQHLRSSIDQLALLYSVSNPLVAHIAAVDYIGGENGGLATDYSTALALADDIGLGLVSSASTYEIQHMSLFATLLASIVPSVHIYDGINVARETTRVVDALDQQKLHTYYKQILEQASGPEKKHSDNEGRVIKLLKAFNDKLGTDYKLFEYHGHEQAESVVVVFGTVEASLTKDVVSSLAKSGVKIGVVNVRVYRPFVEEEFIEALPKSVKTVGVLGQVRSEAAVADAAEHSMLYSDVLTALSLSDKFSKVPSVSDLKYSRQQAWTPKKLLEILAPLDAGLGGRTHEAVADDSLKQYTFWTTDDSPAVSAPLVLGSLISKASSGNVSVRTGHDNLIQGGVVRTDIRASNKSIESLYSVEQADTVVVAQEKLLSEFDVINSLKQGGTLLTVQHGAKDEELEKKFTVGVRKGIFSRDIQLYILDPSASKQVLDSGSLEGYLLQLAFLKVARNDLLVAGRDKLADINGHPEVFKSLTEELNTALRPVKVPESWGTIEPEVESISLPTDINVNSFAAFEKIEPEPPTYLRDWRVAAKGLAFKEAFGTKTALRPDLGVKTAVITVKERRRLTPMTYDRNIFHIDFDLGDSGLTYDIGEALGVHAENDKAEVEEFIKWYGLNPNEVVEVPTRDDPNVLENRTVYQALMQNVDIFGRPPKRFYDALAEFASDPKEKENLLALSTPDGATEFKRRAEVDTITYADILLEFPSAHPSFHDIIRIVSPMKRREYSIASSQKVQPNTISLLIVTVNWVDPRGRDRFGQATRYLNSLPVGSPVTVSVKPSVMKLPTKTTAPLIMAGLGTGLAPFRAFVQERALQKQQGHEIGSILLYMGSRHQREEYLYGEEWEAYRDAGVITLLGRAFSRDQPQKIYIQDRMRQTLKEIREAYLKEEGAFYLCGPTWPVPDVTEVLKEAITEEGKAQGKKTDANKEIEKLKDELRYVLEVY